MKKRVIKVIGFSVLVIALLVVCINSLSTNVSKKENEFFTKEEANKFFTKEDVIMLGDAVYELICRGNFENREIPEEYKRAILLSMSVVVNRIDSQLISEESLKDVFSKYEKRIQKRIGEQRAVTEGHPEVYEYAEFILSYGSIGPKNMLGEYPDDTVGGVPLEKIYDRCGGFVFYTE